MQHTNTIFILSMCLLCSDQSFIQDSETPWVFTPLHATFKCNAAQAEQKNHVLHLLQHLYKTIITYINSINRESERLLSILDLYYILLCNMQIQYYSILLTPQSGLWLMILRPICLFCLSVCCVPRDRMIRWGW